MAYSRLLYLTNPMINGDDVKEVQSRLNNLGYNCGAADCWFGPQTDTAVRNFQGAKGLTVDGVVGPNTWNTLFTTLAYSRLLYSTSPMINGDDVMSVQTKLNSLGYNCGTADGWFGSLTDSAVRNFQRAKGLNIDGIVGPNTWNALFETTSAGGGGTASGDGSSIGTKQISDAGVSFIAGYEGFSSTAYRGADSQNLTIGYGHVIIPGDGLSASSVLTQSEAWSLLKSDLQSRVNTVNNLTAGVSLNQHQFDSLVSFQFNTGSLGSSTLLKDVKAGASVDIIKNDFLMWVYCNGVVLEGLKSRRTDEWEMYAYGDYTRNN